MKVIFFEAVDEVEEEAWTARESSHWWETSESLNADSKPMPKASNVVAYELIEIFNRHLTTMESLIVSWPSRRRRFVTFRKNTRLPDTKQSSTTSFGHAGQMLLLTGAVDTGRWFIETTVRDGHKKNGPKGFRKHEKDSIAFRTVFVTPPRICVLTIDHARYIKDEGVLFSLYDINQKRSTVL